MELRFCWSSSNASKSQDRAADIENEWVAIEEAVLRDPASGNLKMHSGFNTANFHRTKINCCADETTEGAGWNKFQNHMREETAVDILHFCGHGSETAVGSYRRTILFDGVSTSKFAESVCKYQPACVVLSACNTKPEAEEIAKVAQGKMQTGEWTGASQSLTVIYWNSEVEVKQLLGQFASDFYTALGTYQKKAASAGILDPGSAKVFEQAYNDMSSRLPWAENKEHDPMQTAAERNSTDYCCATLQHDHGLGTLYHGPTRLNQLEALQVVGGNIKYLDIFGLPPTELEPEAEPASASERTDSILLATASGVPIAG
jgi:hypothetical protein